MVNLLALLICVAPETGDICLKAKMLAESRGYKVDVLYANSVPSEESLYSTAWNEMLYNRKQYTLGLIVSKDGRYMVPLTPVA